MLKQRLTNDEPNVYECAADDSRVEPCLEETFGRRCSGPFIMSCDVGLVAQADCRALGFDTCAVLSDGVAVCE